MDPSIMKLLEDDEDETMHSGADVEAFTAALNREVEGGEALPPAAAAATAAPQPSDPSAGTLSQESSSKSNQNLGQWQGSVGTLSQESSTKSNQNLGQWQGSVKDETGNQESQQRDLEHLHLQKQSSGAEMVLDAANNQSQQISSQSAHDYQLRQAETSTFLQKEPINSFQQGIAALKQEINQPAEQQQQQQQMKSQHAPGVSQTNSATGIVKPPVIPFHMLIPILSRHLDKDRDMQVQSIFAKLRKNEVSKDHFLRVMRNIVGDQMLRQAAQQIQMQHAAKAQRNLQTNTNQYSLLNQASAQRQASSGSRQADEPKAFPSAHSMPSKQAVDSPKSPHFAPASTVQMQTSTCYPAPESNIQKSRESGNKPDIKGVQARQMRATNVHSISLQPTQHHMQHPQTSLPLYGTSNIHVRPFSRPLGASITSLRPQVPDSNTKTPLSQGAVPRQTGAIPTRPTLQHNPASWQLSANKEKKPNSFAPTAYLNQDVGSQYTESTERSQTFGPLHGKAVNPALGSSTDGMYENRSSTAGASITSVATTSSSQTYRPQGTQAEPSMQISSTMPTAQFAGATAKTPQKKPSVGQKKPLEALGSSPPSSSKKQKTSGAFIDQSIEHLNDVTAVSGVNLREEEEQLLSAPKEESRVSEAARRLAQEEEERLILEQGPLKKKLEEIMGIYNLKSIGSDVERCLSMCVEERLRGIVSNLTRLSKQRIDVEKTVHQFVTTSDVRRQILLMNRKAKEDWDRKLVEEAEKLKKQSDTNNNTGVDSEKDKDEGRSNSKNAKAYREEDDKTRTTAANVAARAAVGGADVMSKWQLMAAERAKQGNEGPDGPSSSLPGKASVQKTLSKSGKGSREHQESEKSGHLGILGSGGMIRPGRSQVMLPHLKVARSISIKDVISVLEREPQMSKSSLLYRLYERLPTNSAAE